MGEIHRERHAVPRTGLIVYVPLLLIGLCTGLGGQSLNSEREDAARLLLPIYYRRRNQAA
jgi:hypothetical protein